MGAEDPRLLLRAINRAMQGTVTRRGRQIVIPISKGLFDRLTNYAAATTAKRRRPPPRPRQ